MTRSQFQSLIRWRPLPYLVAVLFTLMVFGLHMLPSMDSMLNENNTRISHGFLKSQIDYHQEIAPFARRPLTSFLIEGAMRHLELRAGHAFILVNFVLLFLSGTLMFKLSRTLKATTAQGLINLCVYFLSFSVLFAFFPPVFSYDEPLQYCFIFLSLIAFIQRKWLAFVPFFTLAMISRETRLLLLPALVCFAPGLKFPSKLFSKAHLRFCVPVMLPLVLYGVYITLFISSQDQLEATQIEMSSRYSCFLENFESIKNTMESWTSLFLALGPFLYLVAVQSKEKTMPLYLKKWIGAFLLTAIINTPLVILTAFARETRLFALPLIFIWPVFVQTFSREIQLLSSMKYYLKMGRTWRYPILFLLTVSASFWYCFRFYPALGLGENTFFGEYIFLTNLAILLHLLLYQFRDRHHRT